VKLPKTIGLAALLMPLVAWSQAGDAAQTDGTDAPAASAGTDTAGTVKKPPAVSFPCQQQAEFRAFDFWLGEWEVRTADGRLAGHNSIKAAEQGCVLLENWRGAGGSTGMSVNYLDKSTGEWVQIWNDASGSQINIRGGLTDEGMLLVGRIHYIARGTTAAFRGLWTPLDDGRVRQFFEQSNDGGKNWSKWFEGFYSRIDQSRQTD